MDQWKIWVDTGGTFTDCIAISPGGRTKKLKVLSNSSLRGEITKRLNPRTFQVAVDWEAPDNFIKGFSLQLFSRSEEPVEVSRFDASTSRIHLNSPLEIEDDGFPMPFQVLSPYEAPVLAARLITQTPSDAPLPSLQMRLATTKGTNALLEKKGAPTLFMTTKGFKDLLEIGDQKRNELFALNLKKEEQLYDRVIEIDERLDAEGNILKKPDYEALENMLDRVAHDSTIAIAICLMHSYANADHENELADWLKSRGYKNVSASSSLSPFIKMLPRAQTSLVNAYLDPVLKNYLNDVAEELSGGSLRIMTSAGGLVDAPDFAPKDSLLSGPAGGVVGAASTGKQHGCTKIISFDMGGTSTDVARYNAGYDYTFNHTVGHAHLSAPALSIETVAAGGGSICSFDGQKLTVGPDSAGALPGPACYGAGGPLTITDVNLLLGRLDPENFGIPISIDAAKEQWDRLIVKLDNHLDELPPGQQVLEGFIKIANERMADAISKISMRKGYDPSEYAMVAFGGAGAQHACSIADQLNIEDVLIPSRAGLLSAYGLGHAVIERFVEKQVLAPLERIHDSLSDLIEDLQEEALNKLRASEPDASVAIRRNLIFMRLKGQESTLEVSYCDNLREAFKNAYVLQYGHWISGREIEVESIRVVASTDRPHYAFSEKEGHSSTAPLKHQDMHFYGKTYTAPVYRRQQLPIGHKIKGPALILDPHSSIVIDPGWIGTVQNDLTIRLRAPEQIQKHGRDKGAGTDSEAINLELFTNRFTGIAEEMGEMLKRTALSVNVKERMDYSCALLNAEGQLIVNAPHIPVHLGALGICVRKLKEHIDMNPGDVVVCNHPAFGGSHLPDVTVVTPIFDEGHILLGYAASRAHHAEIGGTRPGSMPPNAVTLAEEGVVIPPMHLIKDGKEQWDAMRRHLQSAKHPSRNVPENIADLQAAVAANHKGAASLRKLVAHSGRTEVCHYMDLIKDKAAHKAGQMLRQLPDATYSSTETLDHGAVLSAEIIKEGGRLSIDFEGTSKEHSGNLNATPAIVSSVILYVLRVLIDEDLPLNEGLLDPVDITLPECLLNPEFSEDPERCPALVGGNTEVSQRLVDLLLKPFGRIACSQGTMNNVLFGNERFGYYETIGGGTGAGPSFNGTDAVHHHMTNTAGTDPEILEQRYPVRLQQYAIRKNSGGEGMFKGGNGIVRELTFLEPVSLSVLTQHRNIAPYGLKGGKPGSTGKQWVLRKNGEQEELGPVDGRELLAGDRFIIQTPGGGGYGKE